MKPIFHFVSSLIACIIIYFASKSLLASILCFCTGFFIDLDHLIDFWYSRPKNPLSVSNFLHSKKYVYKNNKLFVLAHAWEYLIVLIIIGFYLNWPWWLIGLLTGITLHYSLDIYNLANKKTNKIAYLITYRLIKNFKIFKNENKKTK